MQVLRREGIISMEEGMHSNPSRIRQKYVVLSSVEMRFFVIWFIGRALLCRIVREETHLKRYGTTEPGLLGLLLLL